MRIHEASSVKRVLTAAQEVKESWLPEPIEKGDLFYETFEPTYGCGSTEDINVKRDPFKGSFLCLPPSTLTEVGSFESWQTYKGDYLWMPSEIAAIEKVIPRVMTYEWKKITIEGEKWLTVDSFIQMINGRMIPMDTIGRVIGSRLLVAAAFGLYKDVVYFDRRDYD